MYLQQKQAAAYYYQGYHRQRQYCSSSHAKAIRTNEKAKYSNGT